jgi:hypothetical protein
MKVGDLVRPRNARKAMGLVVKIKPEPYVEVQWVGKSCALNRTYPKYKLEVINEKK